MSNKIIYFLTEDWFFCSHFLDRAVAAKSYGYEVLVIAKAGESINQIRNAGIRFEEIDIKRSSINLISELKVFWNIFLFYRKERPCIVHHVSAKPIFYGTLAALLCNTKSIVNAPIGLGYVFSSNSFLAIFLRPFVLFAYFLLLNPKNSRVIFENSDDLKYFIKKRIVRSSEALLIRGAGVNVKTFMPVIKNNAIPVVALASRMLKDKGVYEFIEAVRLLKKNKVLANFVLIGAPDLDNPTSISEDELITWKSLKLVEWLGWRQDIHRLFMEVDILCLPSYREGLPKVLIEGCASGLPIVTTDTVGCREIVKNGENGFLVPVKDVNSLSKALEILISNQEMRAKMGKMSREIALADFSNERIISETLDVYKCLTSNFSKSTK